MGRGRKGVVTQGNGELLPKEDRIIFPIGKKETPNQTIADIPEEVLNELRQLNPRAVANILVNS